MNTNVPHVPKVAKRKTTNTISLGKGNSVSLVLQGYTSFEKYLRASLRSGSIFSKNLAGQGHGIVVCPMKSCWFQ
jgi:hypothetical protein